MIQVKQFFSLPEVTQQQEYSIQKRQYKGVWNYKNDQGA